MDLLVIKSHQKYIRIREGRYQLGSLEKASVFPVDRLDEVQYHLETIRKQGISGAQIYRLTLTEEPLM
jgi:hypothetical protein